MAIELIDRGPGPPTREALAHVVGQAKAADPLAPVTVVVATNAVGVASRRFLARALDGIAGLDMVTVFRLAERLGAPDLARAGRRPVSTAVLTAAVRSALASEPGLFADVADHPATEHNIVRIHRELSELDADQLTTLGEQSPRSAAVVTIHHAVRARLDGDWYGEHDLVDAAVIAVQADPEAAIRLGTVVWHLPDRLSIGQGRLGQVIASTTRSFVVVGLTGEAQADQAARTSLGRLGVTPPDVPRPVDHQPSAPVRTISVTDPDDEVRSALREIIGRATTGTPLERMALLAPRDVPYQRIIHDQLTGAGVPFHNARGRPLGAFALARRLLRFLGLRDHNYARPDVLALLCDDPTAERAAEWETQSRAAGIVDGAAAWTDRLGAHADACRTKADAVPRAAAGRLHRAADDADALSAAATAIIADLERGATLHRWSDLVEWCTAAMATHLGSESERSSWPEPEEAAATQLVGVIQRLTGLEAVEPAPTFLAFRRTIELELAERRIREGRVGEGLLVGPLAAALGIELDLAVIVGMAEGVIPTTPSDDSVIPDRERRSVGDALALRSDGTHQQRRDFLVALAEAHESILVRPRSDLRRTLRLPRSRWIPAHATDIEISSFISGIAGADTPASAQDWALRQLTAAASAVSTEPTEPHPPDSNVVAELLTDPTLHRGAQLVSARHSGTFTRFDGNLSRLTMPSPLEQPQSATRLEAWATCPHAYLMQEVLRVDAVEDPEAVEELTPIRSGSLVHDILDRFVRAGLNRPPGEPWPSSAHAEIQAIADRAFAEAEAEGGTGRAAHWSRYRARVRRELNEFVERDSQRLVDEQLAPAAAELRFGLSDSDQPAVRVPLASGREMRVRGAIDRVDRGADGRLVVIDYKTGRKTRYTGLDETNPHGNGSHLQLPLYALAARQWSGSDAAIEAYYWFVSERGSFHTVGYTVTPDALADSIGAIEQVVAGIEQGLFPARPEAPTSYQHFVPCRFCDPDGLGTKDAYQRWLRIRTAPELAPYLDLVEPPELALDV